MTQASPTLASQNARTARETKSRAKAGKAPIIQVRNLEKTYTTARGALTLFQGLSLDVQAGEMVAIVGQSGAGKSTLLHILGALDAPTAGTVTCASVNVAQLSPQEAAAFRNREIGYVWQFHYLLPEFTALENVAMPLLARGIGRRDAWQRNQLAMFERYTEKARRVIFFARYEASQFGSPYIETEHLLLGLLREDKALTNRFLRSHASVESIRKQIEAHTTIREKVSTSVDLPLSNECKRVLAYAAEEAERLGHKHIGTEHLLLGLLREEKCFASEILQERGLKLAQIREELARVTQEKAPPRSSASASPACWPSSAAT
jgi:ABC-type sugar transport system ATPase subunit